MSYSRINCIAFDVVFPAGIAVGASSSSNFTEVDKNGNCEVVVRGTSIAGVLRHEYSVQYGEDETNKLFGTALNSKKNEGIHSRIRFFDAVLNTGKSSDVLERTHISVDRHWGRVTKHALFSFEACPPGTSANLLIEIYGDNSDELRKEVRRIVSLLYRGIFLGGNSNRGIGLMSILDKIRTRLFELQDLDDYSEYLNFKREWKQGHKEYPENSEEHESGNAVFDTLRVDLGFSIPHGQDILVADEDGAMQHQQVVAADGKDYWRLPGASVRGVIRAFITNLAAREGEKVAYSLEQLRKQSEEDISAEQGWLFDKPAEGSDRKSELHDEYAVASLFGSLHAAGRLHISDSYIPVSDLGEQERAHVAVDSITGGAIEGMLFTNNVLTSEISDSYKFTTTIFIKHPSEKDAKWLVSAPKSIDSGFLRLGSSKASGRLEILEPPNASGKLEEIFRKMWKEV